MKCSNCRKDARLLKEHPGNPELGVCTICEITLSRQFPGVSGVEHPNEVDPSNPDPQKALDLTLKYCTETTGPNHMSEADAALVRRVHARDFAKANRAMHQVPDRTLAAQREKIQSMTQSDLDDHNKRTRVLREGLEHAQSFFEQAKAKAGKGAPNVVIDIP